MGYMFLKSSEKEGFNGEGESEKRTGHIRGWTKDDRSTPTKMGPPVMRNPIVRCHVILTTL